MSKKSFIERLEAAVKVVANNYPSAGLTSGYMTVGNVTSKSPDRMFYIWSRLPLISTHNGRELLQWGGVPAGDEDRMRDLAEFAEKETGLEHHVRWSLKMATL